MNTQTLKHNKINKQIDLVDFYNKATKDYEYWSKDFNMHFGYFKWLNTNPFKRDSMLNQMNNEVLKRLHISNKSHRLIDLGCGMGGTMHYALKKFKNLMAYGVTLSKTQTIEGNKRLFNKNGIILQENYNNTSFKNETFNSALAIESLCHSGHNKKALQEAYRILKPKGKLVIADAFLKKDSSKLCHGSKYTYKKLCAHWSLERLATIKGITEDLKQSGFSSINVEDISFRVAPSVLHVPFAITGFILKKLYKSKPIGLESWHNLKGSFYALACGLHSYSFGYYLVSATKP